MTRKATLVVMFVVFFCGAVCGQASDPSTLYTAADLEFTAVVKNVDSSAGRVTFELSGGQKIKGKIGKGTIVAEVPKDSGCHRFEERHRYLVYARKMADVIWVDPCGGSKLISEAEPDLRYIHSVQPNVSEQCNKKRLHSLSAKTPVITLAEVINTEDEIRASPLLFRPWCGIAWSSEYAYYKVKEVLKGQIDDHKIVVEHAICWDRITVDGYYPQLSPRLFKSGNALLLFLEPGSHAGEHPIPTAFKLIFEDVDEDCGAVLADDEAAASVIQELRSGK